jgi:hypothetical protein
LYLYARTVAVQAGFAHGDVRPPNVARNAHTSQHFLIDLEMAKKVDGSLGTHPEQLRDMVMLAETLKTLWPAIASHPFLQVMMKGNTDASSLLAQLPSA